MTSSHNDWELHRAKDYIEYITACHAMAKKKYAVNYRKNGTVPVLYRYRPDEIKSTGYPKNFWSGKAVAYRPKLWRIYITYLN